MNVQGKVSVVHVVVCRRVNLEGVGLCCESIYVSVLVSGDWSVCKA